MYLKKTRKYGNRIEIRKYHTSRYGVKGEKRNRRQQPTPEAVARNNEREAERRLERLLVGNFTEDDHFVTLTYRKEDRPGVEKSKEILRKFFRLMRKAYRAAGIELKYIVTTEWNKKNIHHHLVVNDMPHFNRTVSTLWKNGGIHETPMFQGRDYAGLAEYLIKETKETFRDKENPYRQRYACSRNLKKPEETVEIIKASSWREIPQVPKKLQAEGYVLDVDSIEQGIDIFGYPFMEYIMVRRE